MKRKCRMTPEEKEIHDRATKLRRMTDAQLVAYVDGLKNKDLQEETEDDGYELRRFLEEIAILPGIGRTTVKKLENYAKEAGYIG